MKREIYDTLDKSVNINVNEPASIFVIARLDIYIEGLVHVIQDQLGYRVTSCIEPGIDCFDKFSKSRADILLVQQAAVEYHLELEPGQPIFDKFLATFPGLKIIVFGQDMPEDFMLSMLKSGVHGVVDSADRSKLLGYAIREVVSGGYWLGRKMTRDLISMVTEVENIVTRGIQDKIHVIKNTLTPRETDVLRHVLDGASTKEIAYSLNLSEQSVKLHLGRLFKKFDVTNRSQLILMAFQRVCPASNMIQLFRKTLDRKRIQKGDRPIIDDPLADI